MSSVVAPSFAPESTARDSAVGSLKDSQPEARPICDSDTRNDSGRKATCTAPEIRFEAMENSDVMKWLCDASRVPKERPELKTFSDRETFLLQREVLEADGSCAKLAALVVPCMEIAHSGWILGLYYHMQSDAARSSVIARSENNPFVGRSFLGSRFALKIPSKNDRETGRIGSNAALVEMHALAKGGWVLETRTQTVYGGLVAREFREVLHFESRARTSTWKPPRMADLIFRSLAAEHVECFLCAQNGRRVTICNNNNERSSSDKNSHSRSPEPCECMKLYEKQSSSLHAVVGEEMMTVRSRFAQVFGPSCVWMQRRSTRAFSVWETELVDMNAVVRGWEVGLVQQADSVVESDEARDLRAKFEKEWPGCIEKVAEVEALGSDDNSKTIAKQASVRSGAVGAVKTNAVGAATTAAGDGVVKDEEGGVKRKKGRGWPLGKKRGKKPKKVEAGAAPGAAVAVDTANVAVGGGGGVGEPVRDTGSEAGERMEL